MFILFPTFPVKTYAPPAGAVMIMPVAPTRGTAFRPMFSIIRFVLIVGVIFYYSPVRERGDGPALDPLLGRGRGASEPAPAAPETAGRLEAIWKALPDGAKQAVIDRILTSPGPVATATDTLHPDERHPAYGNKPRI